MADANERAERQGRILAELTEIGMAAARKLSARLEEAETVVECERLVLSLHRISRCVRLTLALESQLEDERRKAVRDEGYVRKEAVQHRRKQVYRAVTGRIYAEREGEEAEALLQDLSHLLDEHVLYEAFLDRPLEAVIARLCRELDLALAASNDAAAQDQGATGPPPRAAPGLAATGPP